MFQNVSTQNVNFQSKNSNDSVARANASARTTKLLASVRKRSWFSLRKIKINGVGLGLQVAKERINYVYTVGNVILNLTIQKNDNVNNSLQ